MPKISEKKTILVSGGAGFIGSHLCEKLLKTCNVICVDNFITSSELNIDLLLKYPNFVFLRHDICEPLDLEKFPELEQFKINFLEFKKFIIWPVQLRLKISKNIKYKRF